MMITYNTTTKKGFGRGKTLGFPTINMVIPEILQKEKRGIYAARVTLGTQLYDAALYFGPPITFGDTTEQLEVYLLSGAEIIDTPAGTPIQCSHVAFIRDVATFDTPEALTLQMHADILAIQNILSQ
jgi:riboflavin kinase / FMN adenylyltransferase